MLFQPRLFELMEIDPEQEFRNIFEQLPRYVFNEIEPDPVWDTSLFKSYLRMYHYSLDTVFKANAVVEVYELKE